MGGNVLVVFESGKFRPIAHGKDLRHKAIQGADANSSLDRLTVEHDHVINLMTEMAGTFLAGNFNFNTIAAVIITTAGFRTNFSSSNRVKTGHPLRRPVWRQYPS